MHIFNRFKSQNDRVRRLIRSRDVGKQKKLKYGFYRVLFVFLR